LLLSILEFLGEAWLGVHVETYSGNENDDIEELRRVDVQTRCRLWVQKPAALMSDKECLVF
jgi:hypothetical protein